MLFSWVLPHGQVSISSKLYVMVGVYLLGLKSEMLYGMFLSILGSGWSWTRFWLCKRKLSLGLAKVECNLIGLARGCLSNLKLTLELCIFH